MKRFLRSIWFWLALICVVLSVSLLLFLRRSMVNPMYAALDQLSAANFGDRWSHPEMLKIAELGPKAVPHLRRVLIEADRPATRFLLWLSVKWPAVTKHFRDYPDPSKLQERRSVACQVIRNLGPTAKSAVPEIIKMFKGNTLDSNLAISALMAIGVDAELCERLAAFWEREKNIPVSSKMQIVGALASVKPPSEPILRVFSAALNDPSTYVQQRAAEAVGRLGIRTPEIAMGLKHLQSTTTNHLALITASAALWEIEKDSRHTPSIIAVLNDELQHFVNEFPDGNGGQGITSTEQCFMAAGELVRKMDLDESTKTQTLNLFEKFADKNARIFVRMLLLPAMMDLGFPAGKGIEVCRTGLDRGEIYYRLQAARLLAGISEKHPIGISDLDAMRRNTDIGVRVYGAQIRWRQDHQAQPLLPLLIDALDRAKYQSYYYAEIQPVALQILNEIGPEARDAIPALEKTLSDPNPAMAAMASNALVRIRGPSKP